jgi:hypothetical protein
MRKIDEQVRAAFLTGINIKLSNTRIENNMLFLHGNKIAQLHDNEFLLISLAGYNTKTTRSRINAILPQGYVLKSKNGRPLLNGVEINASEWYKVNASNGIK